MARVTGIGGVFYKVKDPAATRAWYAEHLGVPVTEWGWNFSWKDDGDAAGMTVWSPFPDTSDYFEPGRQPFMINLRVDDLDGLLEGLKARGVEQVGAVQEEPYGRFAWIVDPDGVKVELWQPLTP